MGKETAKAISCVAVALVVAVGLYITKDIKCIAGLVVTVLIWAS